MMASTATPAQAQKPIVNVVPDGSPSEPVGSLKICVCDEIRAAMTAVPMLEGCRYQ